MITNQGRKSWLYTTHTANRTHAQVSSSTDISTLPLREDEGALYLSGLPDWRRGADLSVSIEYRTSITWTVTRPGMDQACAGPGLGSDRGARSSWGTALLRACAELRPTERCLRCARDARGVCERGWFALTFSLNIHTGVMDPVKRTMPAWRWRRGAIRGAPSIGP